MSQNVGQKGSFPPLHLHVRIDWVSTQDPDRHCRRLWRPVTSHVLRGEQDQEQRIWRLTGEWMSVDVDVGEERTLAGDGEESNKRGWCETRG